MGEGGGGETSDKHRWGRTKSHLILRGRRREGAGGMETWNQEGRHERPTLRGRGAALRRQSRPVCSERTQAINPTGETLREREKKKEKKGGYDGLRFCFLTRPPDRLRGLAVKHLSAAAETPQRDASSSSRREAQPLYRAPGHISSDKGGAGTKQKQLLFFRSVAQIHRGRALV